MGSCDKSARHEVVVAVVFPSAYIDVCTCNVTYMCGCVLLVVFVSLERKLGLLVCDSSFMSTMHESVCNSAMACGGVTYRLMHCRCNTVVLRLLFNDCTVVIYTIFCICLYRSMFASVFFL